MHVRFVPEADILDAAGGAVHSIKSGHFLQYFLMSPFYQIARIRGVTPFLCTFAAPLELHVLKAHL